MATPLNIMLQPQAAMNRNDMLDVLSKRPDQRSRMIDAALGHVKGRPTGVLDALGKLGSSAAVAFRESAAEDERAERNRILEATLSDPATSPDDLMRVAVLSGDPNVMRAASAAQKQANFETSRSDTAARNAILDQRANRRLDIMESNTAADNARADEQLKLSRSRLKLAQEAAKRADPVNAMKIRLEALEASGVDPNSPQGQSYVLTGKVSSTLAKPKKLSVTEKKQIFTAEDELVQLDNTAKTLRRALALVRGSAEKGQPGNGVFEGAFAGSRTSAGSKLPDALVPNFIADPATAERSREYSQIMSTAALSQMADTLKGATTDTEMAKFLDLIADPATPNTIKEQTINRMLALAESKGTTLTNRVNQLREGTFFNAPSAGGGKAGPRRKRYNPETDKLE